MYKIINFANIIENKTFKLSETYLTKPFKINEIKKMKMSENSTFPKIINNIRPYYKTNKKHAIFITQGIKKRELYCPNKKKYESFILTPNEIYKNNILISESPSLFSWEKDLFYRFTNGNNISHSIQFLTNNNKYYEYQNMYEVNIEKHYYKQIKNFNENKKDYDDYFDHYEKKIILQGGL